MKQIWDFIRSQRGVSIAELLVSILITGIVMAGAFGFYTKLHGQAETQIEVSEIQNLCRASIEDIKRTMRSAGFKLTGHPAYEINGDSLLIYSDNGGSVDTVAYFLREFSELQYSKMYGLPDGARVSNLIKQHNSGAGEVYADYITGVRFTEIAPGELMIQITAQASRPDEDYVPNNGFRTYTLRERVAVRNML
jgi:hypothetical protein